MPGTSYTFFRVGLGLRVHLASLVDLDAGGAYLYVHSLGAAAGDISSPGFFPNAVGYAAEASLSLRLRLTPPHRPCARAVTSGSTASASTRRSHAAPDRRGGRPVHRRLGRRRAGLRRRGGGGASADEEKPAPAAKPAAGKAKPRRQPEPDLSDDAGE